MGKSWSPTRSSRPRDGFNPKTLIGAKKCPLRLVPPVLDAEVAVVMTVGDCKYTRYNWRTANLSRVTYLEAARRHIDLALDGEDVDEETGRPHEASVAACMAIALDGLMLGNMVDDRDKTGKLKAHHKLMAQRASEIRMEFLLKGAKPAVKRKGKR